MIWLPFSSSKRLFHILRDVLGDVLPQFGIGLEKAKPRWKMGSQPNAYLIEKSGGVDIQSHHKDVWVLWPWKVLSNSEMTRKSDVPSRKTQHLLCFSGGLISPLCFKVLLTLCSVVPSRTWFSVLVAQIMQIRLLCIQSSILNMLVKWEEGKENKGK